MSKRIAVLGSGFAGLSAAAYLAKLGHKVTVFEKNSIAGGRARYFESDGFFFDMGPSWYWMPDVFERFFADFGHRPSDFYQLVRLNPSYRVVFDAKEFIDVPASVNNLGDLLESYEPGAKEALSRFLAEAQYKYEVGMTDLVYKPGLSIIEFADWRVVKGAFRLQLFQNMSAHIRKFFKHPRIVQLLEFPVLFLGAKPQKTPALYSLMNYADIQLGTWYPQGGMHEIVKAMVKVCKAQGVQFAFNQEVTSLEFKDKTIVGLRTNADLHTCDAVVSGADYEHTDQQLTPPELRNYSSSYWQSRTMAPSSLLFYLGIRGKVDKLKHHNLFFDADFNLHAREIYDSPQWPSNPLFYACVPSKTDNTVAPDGCENIFLLMPVAAGLSDSTELQEKYYQVMMNRLEAFTGEEIQNRVIFKRAYSQSNFIQDYHAFKGNAYGLANTLAQTAILKPSLKNKKVSNLYYTGQLTVPGPGVPPSLISGKVVAELAHRELSGKRA